MDSAGEQTRGLSKMIRNRLVSEILPGHYSPEPLNDREAPENESEDGETLPKDMKITQLRHLTLGYFPSL